MAAFIEILSQTQLTLNGSAGVAFWEPAPSDVVDSLGYTDIVFQAYYDSAGLLGAGKSVKYILSHSNTTNVVDFVELTTITFTNTDNPVQIKTPSETFGRFLRLSIEVDGPSTPENYRANLYLKGK